MRGTTDGVRFRVALRAQDGAKRTLFERDLERRDLAADRGMKSFEVELDGGAPADLLLETEAPGAQAEISAYWSEVLIDEP